jgi:hypothetical protein
MNGEKIALRVADGKTKKKRKENKQISLYIWCCAWRG